jgi:hypothetical protein
MAENGEENFCCIRLHILIELQYAIAVGLLRDLEEGETVDWLCGRHFRDWLFDLEGGGLVFVGRGWGIYR